MNDYPFFYRIKKYGSKYFGMPCKVIARSNKNRNVMIEFEDGHRYITCFWGIRKRNIGGKQ